MPNINPSIFKRIGSAIGKWLLQALIDEAVQQIQAKVEAQAGKK